MTIMSERDVVAKGAVTTVGEHMASVIAERDATIADIRSQLAAAREALSNANERALTYDDELRTVRERAERLGQVVEAARTVARYYAAHYDYRVKNRGEHWALDKYTAKLIEEVRALDDASAGES